MAGHFIENKFIKVNFLRFVCNIKDSYYQEIYKSLHLRCLKIVRIRSFSGPYVPAFLPKTDQKTPNTDTFHAVLSPVVTIYPKVYIYILISE